MRDILHATCRGRARCAGFHQSLFCAHRSDGHQITRWRAKRWPSDGYPPLKSTRIPNSTPDRDIAEDLIKQFRKNILDPSADLLPSQKEQLSRLLERDFGTPAEPQVRVPDWNEIMIAALMRPDPSKGVFGNLRPDESAVKNWKAANVRADGRRRTR